MPDDTTISSGTSETTPPVVPVSPVEASTSDLTVTTDPVPTLTALWLDIPVGIRSAAHTFISVFAVDLLVGLSTYVQTQSITKTLVMSLLTTAARTALKAATDSLAAPQS